MNVIITTKLFSTTCLIVSSLFLLENSLQHQVHAFSPLPSKQISSNAGIRKNTALSLFGRKDKLTTKKIRRDWTYIGDDGDEYVSNGHMKVNVFLPKTADETKNDNKGNKVKGCVFFMHGFSQYTPAYEDTLMKAADAANIAIISVDTGILSPIVLFESLKNPFALITDRTRAQFILQRALAEDTKQCIHMVLDRSDVFKEFNIGKNVPMGVCGHSMGGGLSFPVAAEFPQINYVFTMAPISGVDAFDSIKTGVDKRTVNNSMLLNGTWDLIARSNKVKVKDIAEESNKLKKNSSIYVNIDRGLHTGFEDELVITSIPLEKIVSKFFEFNIKDKLLWSVLGLFRTNTGQLEGTEVLLNFFFDKMTKGQKVTLKDAEKHLYENVKTKWDKKFQMMNP